jgi:hypothetical protein
VELPDPLLLFFSSSTAILLVLKIFDNIVTRCLFSVFSTLDVFCYDMMVLAG